MNPHTSRLALWSLVLGILGMLFLLLCLGPLFAIPAVICGHMAHSRISKSAGELSGQGMALSGLITGYMSIGASIFLVPLMIAIAIPNFVRAREVAQRNGCINNLRQIDGAKSQWALETGAEEGQSVISDDIAPYLAEGVGLFTCPAGGTYSFNAVNQDPTCSIPGHTLADPGLNVSLAVTNHLNHEIHESHERSTEE